MYHIWYNIFIMKKMTEYINYIEVDKYYSINSKELIITFLNKKKLVIPVSNNIFTRQLFKASRLDTIFKRNIK